MNIKEISYGKSRKMGLPNYSSVDVHAGITISVDSEEEIPDAKAFAKQYVQSTIDEELRSYTNKPEPEKTTQRVNTVNRG